MTAMEPTSRSLADLEAVIERGVRTFMEVGQALLEIRDGRKYREGGYSDFDAYCRARWGWTKQRAYQLTDAAEVVQHLAESNMFDSGLPENARQAAELARLPDAVSRTEAWAEIVTEHPDSKERTAADVREVVDRRLGVQRPPKAAPVRAVPDPDAYAEPDEDGVLGWQCAGCEQWYGSDVSDCPRCQTGLFDGKTAAAATPPSAPFVMPEMERESPEEKAFYALSRLRVVAQRDPVAVAAVCADPELSCDSYAALADWLDRFVDALRDRVRRPLRVVE